MAEINAYLCEFIGTAFLVLLGDGVCMGATLRKSGFQGAGATFIAIGWGLAVMVPAFCFGYSGASFNPCLTFALAAAGKFPWNAVPGYVVSQMLGGFVGASLLSLLYKKHLDAQEEAGNTTLGVYCTSPAIKNLPLNLLAEAVATFVLVFTICAIPKDAAGLSSFPVFAIIMACGMSLGGLTGYAMNPARDLSPRLAHALFRRHDRNGNDWRYAWVPVAGPLIGGVAGALLARALPFIAFMK